jgi:DNA-binding transcriptional ArsR family regulator
MSGQPQDSCTGSVRAAKGCNKYGRIEDEAHLKRISRSGSVKSVPACGWNGETQFVRSALDIVGYIHYFLVVNVLDTTFAALSDPTRRAMIERLSRGPASVRGLTEPFDLSQQMISKHIATLVRARIVVKKKRGRESVCSLRPEAIKTVNDWAANYRRLWEERLDRLEVVVHQMKKAEVRDGR